MDKQPPQARRLFTRSLIAIFVASALAAAVPAYIEHQRRQAAFDASFRALQEAATAPSDFAAMAQHARQKEEAQRLHDEIQATLKRAAAERASNGKEH